MTLIETIIIGIVEGLTEFLPISSTGHMILASWLLKMENSDFLKTFEIVIQLGAILAVVGIYYKRLLSGVNIYLKLVAAFLPAGLVGFALHKYIKEYLFRPEVVAASLILGGIILIVIDRYLAKISHAKGDGLQATPSTYTTIDDISYLDAFKIGCAQCVAMIPGVSRSAATIVGGIGVGFTARQATEFSFLLAIPTMVAATVLETYKTYKMLHHIDPSKMPTGFTITDGHVVMGSSDYTIFAVGFIIAFLVAGLTVKVLITLIEKYGFKYFGYYRIIVGLIILVLALVFHYNVSAE